MGDPDWTGDSAVLFENISELLLTLVTTWAAGSRTRKRWLNAEVHNHGDIVFLHAFDKSSDTRLQLGLNADALYLEMNIVRSDRLLQMPDDFWIQWLELHYMGQLELIEHEMFPERQIRQHPKLFKSSQGALIPLMRSLLLFPAFNDREMEPGALSVS